MNELYCADCADTETPVMACFVDYGRSLCSPCFFRIRGLDKAVREALGDKDDEQA